MNKKWEFYVLQVELQERVQFEYEFYLHYVWVR